MNIGYKGPVDLDLVGSDVGENGQRRIPGAEVVDRDPDADLAQHRQDLHLELAFGEERVFGELQNETFGAAACRQCVHQRSHEAHIAGLLGSNVDGDGLAAAEFMIEPIDRAYRLGKHEMRNRINDAELGRKTDEFEGRLNIALAVAPAHERLESDHLLAANVDFRLKGTAELAVADGQPQALLQIHPRRNRLPHCRVKKSSTALCAELGPIHGGIRIPSQLFVCAAVLRMDAHPHGSGRKHFEALDVKGLFQLLQQLPHHRPQMSSILDRIDEQKKLIAADAREHIGVPHQLRYAACDLHQQRVANGVIVVVVDVLEIVEIYECQCKRPCPSSYFRRLLTRCSITRRVGRPVSSS